VLLLSVSVYTFAELIALRAHRLFSALQLFHLQRNPAVYFVLCRKGCRILFPPEGELLSSAYSTICTRVSQRLSPQNGTGSGVVLRTKMPRYSQYYGLLLERRDGSHKLSEDMSVGNFFDEEGNFDEEACKKIIAVFVKKFENTKSE
jgi:hypothetical protein